MKGERLHGQRFVTRRAARDEVVAKLLWYNQTRLHSTLAYVSPVQFEQDWLEVQANQVNSCIGYGVRIPGARSISPAVGFHPPSRMSIMVSGEAK